MQRIALAADVITCSRLEETAIPNQVFDPAPNPILEILAKGFREMAIVGIGKSETQASAGHIGWGAIGNLKLFFPPRMGSTSIEPDVSSMSTSGVCTMPVVQNLPVIEKNAPGIVLPVDEIKHYLRKIIRRPPKGP
ncbi:MAG: hypothetical protein ABSG85_02340, partial [Spirochaetia bacterium]